MKRHIPILLLFMSTTMLAQNMDDASLQLLDEYTELFGIQFAYNPKNISASKLEAASSVEDLRRVFRQANVAVVEIAKDRWLLKNTDISQGVKYPQIQGYVRDSDGEPLVSALIYSSSGSKSALTNKDGFFTLQFPLDDDICCQYLGYTVQCLTKEENLLFQLEPLSMFIDDVEIETKKVQCSFSPLEDVELIKITPSGISGSSLAKDVARTVQLLSGVDATNDLSSSLSVRAAEGMQSLVTLDGIPVYNAESAFGMFSVLNPLVVTEARLYKNTLPLEYGEFTGGYLACTGLLDVQDGAKLNIDLNTLQSMAAIQIPLSAKTQISGAFRRSNGRISNSQYYSKLRSRRTNQPQIPDAFERPERVSTNLENRFGDVYMNFLHEWKKSRFRVSFFGNRDISGTSYSDQYLWTRKMKPNVLISEAYMQSKSKANLGLSAEYKRKFASEAEFTIMYYSSSYRMTDLVESDVAFTSRVGEMRDTFDSQIRNTVRDRNLKFQFVTDRSKSWSWKSGVDLRVLSTDFGFRSIKLSPFRQDLEVPIVTPYLGVRYQYKKRFIADMGMRYAIIPVQNAIAFASPRAKILLELEEGWYLKSSISYNQQFFRPIELERQLGQATAANIIAENRDIPIMRSSQLTLGMNYFKNGFKVNADLFTRENSGVLEQVLSRPGLSDATNVFGNNSYQVYQGLNKVLGLDLSTGYEDDRFSGLMSYTYSLSRDQFPDLFNNSSIPDQNNRTHQLNLAGVYESGRWAFSSTFIFGSGVYTLNRAALQEALERNNVDQDKLFRQLPSYNRWDISTSYKIPLRHGSLHLDASLFNLMNRDNVNAELYIWSLNDESQSALGASQVSLLGRIWTLGVRYEL